MAQQQELDAVSKTLDVSISLTCDRVPQSEAQPTSVPTATSAPSDPPSLSRTSSSNSRLNARAPEFVPGNSTVSPSSAPTRMMKGMQVYPAPNSPIRVPIAVNIPVQSHHHLYSPHHIHVPYHHSPSHQQYCGNGGAGGYTNFEYHTQDAASTPKSALVDFHQGSPLDNGISPETAHKIINQVEYYFSDLNLATTEHLMWFINKDPSGFVPISAVASFKKIKALISNNSQLANILQNSTKLVVSEDGKEVRRQQPLTESDMKELQLRIVVAENLPEDHCHQNLMKIFSAVGGVKTIRTCQPQTSNGGAYSTSRVQKSDNTFISKKLHAFVEYESVELAEKAVMELNDEDNWRNGLKVRLLVRRGSKPCQVRTKKHGNGEGNIKEDDPTTSEQLQSNDKHFEDFSQHVGAPLNENVGEEHANEKEGGGQKKGRGHGRGKNRGKGQHGHHYNTRGCHVGSPPPNNPVSLEQVTVSKQPPGPRMPDGTRGFSIGRGKACC